jgi:hypothetical protein
VGSHAFRILSHNLCAQCCSLGEGMLLLLLCNAVTLSEMYWALGEQKGWTRDLVHLYSSKRMWVEADSQILNVLFCITSFGLASWRFSDLYYLLRIADPH